jgi:hypothetical protein
MQGPAECRRTNQGRHRRHRESGTHSAGGLRKSFVIFALIFAFLMYRLMSETFKSEMGGTARWGALFEGANRAAEMASTYRQALLEIADGLSLDDELAGRTIKEIVAKYGNITERRGPMCILPVAS